MRSIAVRWCDGEMVGSVEYPPNVRFAPNCYRIDAAPRTDATCHNRTNVPRRYNYLLTGPGEMILDILRAEEVMNVWIVVMIILLGIGALTLHRYDVWRVLIWIALGWFVLGAFLLGYRGEHL
jgi:hypothetical protein